MEEERNEEIDIKNGIVRSSFLGKMVGVNPVVFLKYGSTLKQPGKNSQDFKSNVRIVNCCLCHKNRSFQRLCFWVRIHHTAKKAVLRVGYMT